MRLLSININDIFLSNGKLILPYLHDEAKINL